MSLDNPLDRDTLGELYSSRREVLGDDLIRPRQMVIGRVASDGSVATSVTSGEYGRVWVREPGEDTGDAAQAINDLLQPHEVSFNRPVLVRKQRGELHIVNKAPGSAAYEALIPPRTQRAVDRTQIDFALVRQTSPPSLSVLYSGAVFTFNNTAYVVTDQASDLSASVPGSNAVSVKVELDPTTSTFTETVGSSFTLKSLFNAYKDGDLNTTRTDGTYLLGWVRLYADQTEITVNDILVAEDFLDLIDDVNEMVGIEDYLYKYPASDTRNLIQPTGDFDPLRFNNPNGTLVLQIESDGDILTDPAEETNTLLGAGVGRPSGDLNTFIGNLAGGSGAGVQNTFIGWEVGNALTTGDNNVGLGVDALWQLESGNRNLAIGMNTLGDLISGDANTAVGYDALYSNTSNANTAVGYQTGGQNANGSLNVFIGYRAGLNETGSSNLYIHNNNSSTPLIRGDFDGGLIFTGQHPGAVSVSIQGAPNQVADVAKVGDVSGGNYTAIEKDGTMRFEGAARVWDDLPIGVSDVRLPASNAPTWTSYKGGEVLAFEPTKTNIIKFEAQLKHGYAEGEDIEFHIHLAYPDANAGDTIWNFTYSWGNIGGTFPTETAVNGVVIASPTTTDFHQLAEIAEPIDGTGKTISSILICHLEREGGAGGDTYGSNVYLTSADFHIPLNTVGSRLEDSK